MDVIFDSFFAQICSIFFVIIFSMAAFFWPRKTALLFPIILPFYLIKEKIVLPGIVLPINILDILIAIFLIINWRLILKGIYSLLSSRATPPWRGSRGLPACPAGRRAGEAGISIVFVISTALLSLASIASTVFAIDQKIALGAAKSWFWLPILLFFALLPFFRSTHYRQKYLFSFFLSGVVLVSMSLPFVLQNLYAYDGRLAGIFLSPNHLAMAIVPGFIALIIILLDKISKSPSPILPMTNKITNRKSQFRIGYWKFIGNWNWSLRFGIIVFLALESFILYLTYSYSTWIALIIASLVVVIPSVSRGLPACPAGRRAGEVGIPFKKLLLYSSTVLLLLTVLIFSQLSNPKLQHIINNDYYSSFHSRIMIWQSALLISKDHWLLGIGAGNFQQAYLDYQKYFPEPYIEWAVPMPHNIFLAFQTQLGILGLISFIFILILTPFVILSDPELVEGESKDPFLKRDSSTPLRFGRNDRRRHQELKIGNWDLGFGNLKNRLSKPDSLSLWALAYLVYVVAHGLTDTPYFKNDLAVIFWLTLAVIWSIKSPLERGHPALRKGRDRGVWNLPKQKSNLSLATHKK